MKFVITEDDTWEGGETRDLLQARFPGVTVELLVWSKFEERFDVFSARVKLACQGGNTLLLCDSLSDSSSNEVLAMMRECSLGQNVRVVAVSGNDSFRGDAEKLGIGASPKGGALDMKLIEDLVKEIPEEAGHELGPKDGRDGSRR